MIESDQNLNHGAHRGHGDEAGRENEFLIADSHRESTIPRRLELRFVEHASPRAVPVILVAQGARRMYKTNCLVSGQLSAVSC